MKVMHYRDILSKEVEEGAKGVKIRWLVSKEDGAPNYQMRLFEVEAGGYTPYHSHDWEHEVFVLEGKGVIKTKDENIEISDGYFAFIKPNEYHQFINTGDKVLKFICVIPVLD